MRLKDVKIVRIAAEKSVTVSRLIIELDVPLYEIDPSDVGELVKCQGETRDVVLKLLFPDEKG